MEKQNLKLYEKRQIPLLVGVLGLLLAALAWSYWIAPMWPEIKQSILDVAKMQSTVEAKQKEMNELTKFGVFLTKEKDKVEAMNTVLPLKEEMDDVLIQMERLAVDNFLFIRGMTVKDPQKDEIEKAGDTGLSKVTLQLTGEYPDLLKFVDAMQKSTRLISVDKLNVAGNVDTENQPVVYSVEMTILYQK